MDISKVHFDKCVKYGEFVQFFFLVEREIFETYELPEGELVSLMVETPIIRPVLPTAKLFLTYVGPENNNAHMFNWDDWKSIDMDERDIRSLVEYAESELEPRERE